jgi:hypothetical protein
MTKLEAINEVKAKGFTYQYDEGESGDCGWGSRLYFCKPPREICIIPKQSATVSKVPGAGWLTSYFGVPQ